MATLGETEVPLNRYDVMVERWESTVKLSVPAFSQQDAINRIVGEPNGKYHCFTKAYAPETERGGGRREDDNGNNGSSNS